MARDIISLSTAVVQVQMQCYVQVYSLAGTFRRREMHELNPLST